MTHQNAPFGKKAEERLKLLEAQKSSVDLVMWFAKSRMCAEALKLLAHIDETREALKDCGCSEALAQEIIDMLCNENNIIDFYNVVDEV